MADFVSRRRVGEATVAAISDGVGPWAPQLSAPEAEWRHEVPEANEAGEFPLEWSVGFASVGGKNVVVDLGFDDPGPASRWMPPRFERSPGVEAGLASLGVQPEQVDYVLITHHHGDHVAGALTRRDGRAVLRYPNARHLINRLDWEEAARQGQRGPGSPLATLKEQGRLDVVEGDREVLPGVALLHAPGESPGHSAIRVSSGGQTAYFFGDLFHHPCEVAHPSWVSPGRDQPVVLASRQRLLAAAADEGAACTFSHARLPAWGRIVRAGAGYRWQWL
jgi:glyoxylase-like metal-dependent hydrolase (beta-lactamase superfamily II)